MSKNRKAVPQFKSVADQSLARRKSEVVSFCGLRGKLGKAAGFTEKDDELPEFFYAEALAPSNKNARHRSAAVNRRMRELLG